MKLPNHAHAVIDIEKLCDYCLDPSHRRGQVGTIVEELAPGVFEVELSDNNGRTYAMLALRADQLLLLHYDAVMGA